MLKKYLLLFTISSIAISLNNIRLSTAIITSVKDNNVYISTDDSNGWGIESNEEKYKSMINCIVVFDDMDTDSIYDDSIITVIGIDK